MNKKLAAAMLFALLCMMTLGAHALTVTGRETETLERIWSQNQFFTRMQALTGIEVEPTGVADEKEYAKLRLPIRLSDASRHFLSCHPL